MIVLNDWIPAGVSGGLRNTTPSEIPRLSRSINQLMSTHVDEKGTNTMLCVANPKRFDRFRITFFNDRRVRIVVCPIHPTRASPSTARGSLPVA